jgi:uncharacterized protein YuzE
MKIRYDKETDILYVSFLNNEILESDEQKPGIIMDYDKDGNIVGFEILGVKRSEITKHLKNVFISGELDEDSTFSILEHVGVDSKQKYRTKYYNLDVILSAGYRVKSINNVAYSGKNDLKISNLKTHPRIFIS